MPDKPGPDEGAPRVLVATFAGPYTLDAAIQELRRLGLPADVIGSISGDHGHLLSVFPPAGRHELIAFVLREQGATTVAQPGELELDYRHIPHPGASEDHDMKLPSGREYPATSLLAPVAPGRVRPRRLPQEERLISFDEVELGFTPGEALWEASRCLQCPEPRCVAGCPAGNDIPAFIRALREGDFARGLSILYRTSSFPAICGRVCDVGRQCEGACVLGEEGEPVAIGSLERFLGDWGMSNGAHPVAAPMLGVTPLLVEHRFERSVALRTAESPHGGQGGAASPQGPQPERGRVAIIGSGPAGLAAAADLAALGYQVTVYEALPVAGGALAWGIPTFRLPQPVLQAELDRVSALGVEIRLGMAVGTQVGLDQLQAEGHRAILVATGTSISTRSGLPGEDLAGLFTATEFLTRAKLSRGHPAYEAPVPGERLVVIGGGNTAMDVAQTALRLGWRQVTVAYRRSREEMPARHEEVEGAEEEGVRLRFLASPVRFLGDNQGRVVAVECLRVELGPPDASGRRRPVPVPGTDFALRADTVVLALGYASDPALAQALPGVATDGGGLILAHPDTGGTRGPGIWAAGDIVTGADTVVRAMAAGRRAARDIHRHLTGDRP